MLQRQSGAAEEESPSPQLRRGRGAPVVPRVADDGSLADPSHVASELVVPSRFGFQFHQGNVAVRRPERLGVPDCLPNRHGTFLVQGAVDQLPGVTVVRVDVHAEMERLRGGYPRSGGFRWNPIHDRNVRLLDLPLLKLPTQVDHGWLRFGNDQESAGGFVESMDRLGSAQGRIRPRLGWSDREGQTRSNRHDAVATLPLSVDDDPGGFVHWRHKSGG
jgi:hypothetical protein